MFCKAELDLFFCFCFLLNCCVLLDFVSTLGGIKKKKKKRIGGWGGGGGGGGGRTGPGMGEKYLLKSLRA